MSKKISERYQKALVTIAMGFRTEDDIKKNGLYRFTKQEESNLINYVKELFEKNKSVLALKIKQTGYKSEHININSDDDLQNFITNVQNIFGEDNEIWIVSSSVIECWRCRIYLSENGEDIFEMAYSYDDHILDHINHENKIPYVRYSRTNFKFNLSNTNTEGEKYMEANSIIQDILDKYSDKFNMIKEDLNFIGVEGISLDIRVNNGYDFHDFDVASGDVKKVINYYLPELFDK